MRSKVRSHRPSHAVVVAYLALFVALGGTATAVTIVTGNNVKNNSLTGADIKTASVTGRDLKNNSVGSLDIKDGNLVAKDFMAGQLPAGPPGPKGNTGAQGPVGPTAARVKSYAGDAPPADPDDEFISDVIVTQAPSRLLIKVEITQITHTCTATPCGIDYGLYVDDQPLNGTAQFWNHFNSATSSRFNVWKLTDVLPAGPHRVSAGYKQQNPGNPVAASGHGTQMAILAVGG